MHTNQIRLVFYLPNLKSYSDRAHLISEIAKRVDKAILVISRQDCDSTLAAVSSHLDIIVLPKRKRIPGRTYFVASSLIADLITQYDINIVHDTFGHLLPLFSYKKSRFPHCTFITSLFNLSEWDLRHFVWSRYHLQCLINKNLRLWLLRVPWQRAICSAADHVVVQAPGLIKRLQEYINLAPEKISWIPNNIKMPQERMVGGMTTPGMIIKLLYVGGFCVAKGGLGLLKLLHLAKNNKIEIQADVIGGMVDLDEKFLSNQITDLDVGDLLTIHDRMSYDEVAQYMRESDWLFHMTDVDGSPRVVLEALSRGLPVIGSSHPGIEVLDPDKKFIQFTNLNDLDRLLEKLIDLQDDCARYSEIVLQGYEYVQRSFSSEKVAERYVELYDSLCARK